MHISSLCTPTVWVIRGHAVLLVTSKNKTDTPARFKDRLCGYTLRATIIDKNGNAHLLKHSRKPDVASQQFY
jgi:hypothetical protein